MCGISGYWCREEVPSANVIFNLLKYGELRGSDAFGYAVIGEEDNYFDVIDSDKFVGTGDLTEISQSISKGLNIGDVMIANHRAAPETECSSIDSRSIQPIIDNTNNITLVHNGSVSKFVYDSLKERAEPVSKIDSEAIIWSYLHHGRNMKRAMEYLSGGFAFIMIDGTKHKMYVVVTHNPMYAGYVRGHGMFFSSTQEAVFKTISNLKGSSIERNNVAVWEDYYCQEIPANTIVEIDMQSGMRNETSFIPRYIHPNWDPITHRSRRQRILVSASGGLDSSTTLVVLKEAGYDVNAVHFKYGHRGQDCEEYAITEICKTLSIPLTIFDIESNMKQLDSNSMLTNKNAKITTGTNDGLKATVAWTCFRNGLFVTYMGALAESLIINDGYGEILITGGFMNLSESGVYPDNSERFINAFIKFAKFASLAGSFIKPMYGCANLLKAEQYILLDKLGYLEKLSPLLISCDRPKMIDGIPHNCSKNNNAACGSGLLSKWASKLAGVKDLRRYYEVDDPDYIAYEPDSKFEVKQIEIEDILKKLQIHPINMRLLMRKLC